MNNWRGLDLAQYDAVIIGGGGLLNEENVPTIQDVIKQAKKVILWAVGTNSINAEWTIPDLRADNVRGWLRHENPFFPVGVCPSCMLLELNAPIWPVRHDVIYVSHKDRPLLAPNGFPQITNQWAAPNMIRFIQSARHVITNSYHAAYYAYLCRVPTTIIDPWSTKLNHCLEVWEIVGALQEHRSLAVKMYQETCDWITK